MLERTVCLERAEDASALVTNITLYVDDMLLLTETSQIIASMLKIWPKQTNYYFFLPLTILFFTFFNFSFADFSSSLVSHIHFHCC